MSLSAAATSSISVAHRTLDARHAPRPIGRAQTAFARAQIPAARCQRRAHKAGQIDAAKRARNDAVCSRGRWSGVSCGVRLPWRVRRLSRRGRRSAGGAGGAAALRLASDCRAPGRPWSRESARSCAVKCGGAASSISSFSAPLTTNGSPQRLAIDRVVSVQLARDAGHDQRLTAQAADR